MPPKKTKPGEDEPLETPPDPTVPDSLADQFETDRAVRGIEDIENLLRDTNLDNAQVAVKKIDPVDRKAVHLERLSIEAFRPDVEEFLRSRYGGGKYKLFFYPGDRSHNGACYTVKIFNIDMACPPGEFYREQQKMYKEPSKHDDSALLVALDKIKTEGGGQSELMIAMMQMQQQSSQNMMTMISQTNATMMTAMTQMVAALGKGGGGSQPLDMLQMLKVFKDLSGGNQTSDPVKLLEFAHKLSREFSDKDEDEPGWLKALTQILPALMPRPMLPPPGAQTPAVPQPALEPAPPAPPVFSEPEMQLSNPEPEPDMLQRFLPVKVLANHILPRLLAGIDQGATPEDALDMFNNPLSPNALTDKQFDELMTILKREDWAKELFDDEGKILAQREWFDKLRDLILESGKEEKPASE